MNITLGNREVVDAYRRHKALSQSYLKLICDGKENETFEETNAMLLGTVLDFILTMDNSNLDDFVYITTTKQPSDDVVALINQFFSYLQFANEFTEKSELNSNLETYAVEIEQFLEANSGVFYPNYKIEKRVETFISKARDYFKDSIESQGKLVVSDKIFQEKEKLATKVRQTFPYLFGEPHKITKEIRDEMKQCEFQSLTFQFPLMFKIQDIHCKGLCDMVLEYDNCIFEVDIKHTTANTIEDWVKIAKSLNYPFQKSFYRFGLEQRFMKPIFQYWLVVSEKFITLVPVTEHILKFGKYGYEEHKSFTNLEAAIFSDDEKEELVDQGLLLHGSMVPSISKKMGVWGAINYYINWLEKGPEVKEQPTISEADINKMWLGQN